MLFPNNSKNEFSRSIQLTLTAYTIVDAEAGAGAGAGSPTQNLKKN